MNIKKQNRQGLRSGGATNLKTTILFGLLSIGLLAYADTTWDGSESSDWFDVNNWSAGLPDSSDIAFIGSSPFPDITGSGNDAEAKRILVGYNTSVILDITDGAVLTTTQNINQPNYLGYNAVGLVYLDGTGSVWNAHGSTPSNQAAIRIGYASPDETRGRLKIENGAHVSISGGAGISLWSWDQGFGNYLRSQIFIGEGNAAGTLDAGWIDGDSGATADSELRFDHNNSSYYFTDDGSASGDAVEVRGQITVYHYGTGTTHFAGPNTYSGGTSIGEGTLAVSQNSHLGDNAGPIRFISPSTTGTLYATSGFTNEHAVDLSLSSGIIEVGGGQTLRQNAAVSGDEALIKSGAGTLLYAVTNTHSGTTTIRGGTLQVGDGTSRDGTLGSGAVVIDSGATLAFSHDGGYGDHPISNNLSGAGNVVITGMNDYEFRGTNTYSGTTTIGVDNRLELSNPNSIGPGDIAVHGSLYLNADTNITLNNTLTGNGTVSLRAGGTTLTVTNDSTFAGDVEISTDSVLQLGNGGTGGRFNTGSITLSDGSLIINRSDTFTLSNEVTGAGTILMDGSGTVTFTGTGSSDYTDAAFIVSNGTLRLADGITAVDSVTISDGTALDADIGGYIAQVNVANGGTLYPADNGDLDVYQLHLNASSHIVLELGAPGSISNDSISVFQELVLDGIVDIEAQNGFGAGEYEIIIPPFLESGTTDNGLEVGNVPAGFDAEMVYDDDAGAFVLVVTESVYTLQDFRIQYGLNPDGSDDSLDWSTNGIANIHYYLSGLGDPNTNAISHTDPDTATPGLMTIGHNDGTTAVTVAYTRLVSATDEGATGVPQTPNTQSITYIPQVATNLLEAAPWTDLSSLTGNRAPTGTNTVPVDADYEIIELEFSTSPPSPSYFRIRTVINE